MLSICIGIPMLLILLLHIFMLLHVHADSVNIKVASTSEGDGVSDVLKTAIRFMEGQWSAKNADRGTIHESQEDADIKSAMLKAQFKKEEELAKIAEEQTKVVKLDADNHGKKARASCLMSMLDSGHLKEEHIVAFQQELYELVRD